MKINKNIITTILVSVLFFSTSKIASADTFNITYKPSDNKDFVTTVVDYGLNKRTYKQGEVVRPAGNAYAFSIRCLNAGDVNASLKAVFSNFEIGNPGSSYSTYTKTELSGPTSYISGGDIYINGNLFTQMVDYLDSSHYTEVYIPSYGYQNVQRTIDISSIPRVDIDSNGDAYASEYNYAEVWNDDEMYGMYGMGMIAPAELGYRPYKVATGLLQAYQSGIRTLGNYITIRRFINFTDTRSILMRSGTLVYGSLSLPGSVTIPSNATPGTYVAQVDFNPGWNGFPNPRKSLTTGAWNTKTCWDGSQVPQSQDCPIQLKTCPDGARIPIGQACTTQRCWDGSVIPTSQNCPTQPAQTKTCQNGSVVNINETCYKTCSNGQTIPESQTCPKLLPPIDQDCSDPDTPCKMLYFFEKFFNIKRASARIAPQEMEVYEMNGGGGYSGGGTYTPPASCGSSWWCTITLSAVTISQPFEVISTNQAPTVQIK